VSKPEILVVEDDAHALQGLVAGLTRHGFAVSVATDGITASERVLHERFDFVVLDLMLPGATGFQVLEAMAGRVSTPVLVLSARTELKARLESFRLGAVDYVPKPFFVEELVARIRARLALREDHRTVAFGEVLVDLDARQVTRAGEDLGLTKYEFNLLAWLVERPGRAVSRDELAEHALGAEGVTARTVDSHLSRVRQKLGPDGGRVETVWGIGYRFDT
jgi:two-component system, OmpR family, response regulator